MGYQKSEYKIRKQHQFCLKCGFELGKNGSRTRNFKGEYAEEYEIRIRLFHCSGCNIYYTEVPDCFEERSRYHNDVKAEVLGNPNYVEKGPSRSTRWRWKKADDHTAMKPMEGKKDV